MHGAGTAHAMFHAAIGRILCMHIPLLPSFLFHHVQLNSTQHDPVFPCPSRFLHVLGSPNCCALVELQPESKLGYQHTRGYMNLARLFGLHYYRYQAKDGLTGTNGTVIDIDNVTDLVRQVVISSHLSLLRHFPTPTLPFAHFLSFSSPFFIPFLRFFALSASLMYPMYNQSTALLLLPINRQC